MEMNLKLIRLCTPQYKSVYQSSNGSDVRKPVLGGGGGGGAGGGSLISAFVFCILESVISKLATSEISTL